MHYPQKKGGRKTGCGRDGKGERRGREHSLGMNGRSKSRVNSAKAAGAFPCITKIDYLK